MKPQSNTHIEHIARIIDPQPFNRLHPLYSDRSRKKVALSRAVRVFAAVQQIIEESDRKREIKTKGNTRP